MNVYVDCIFHRVIWMRSGRGKTYISSGILLPSKVTHLVIKRPHHFYFRPGDYVFVNIPAIAKYEWHPFTLSSAPEQEGILIIWYVFCCCCCCKTVTMPHSPYHYTIRRLYVAAHSRCRRMDQHTLQLLRAWKRATAQWWSHAIRTAKRFQIEYIGIESTTGITLHAATRFPQPEHNPPEPWTHDKGLQSR